VHDETRVRLDAIHYVRLQRERWVAVPAAELRTFESGGRRVHLKGQQGIFKPAELSEPLSITSTIDSPYNDNTVDGTRVLYDFLPASRQHDNEGLKRCAELELPLIYLLQVKRRPGPEYVVFAPVYVIGWDDAARTFLVDLSEQTPGAVASPVPSRRQLDLAWVHQASANEVRELTRTYVATSVQRRLYDAKFRNKILRAYRERCAVCGLGIRSLLDAAHVSGDRDPKPAIEVSDGIALCAIHHRAFECGMLTWDDDYRVRIHLPSPGEAGDGERQMLLAFEGKLLSLPKRADWRPLSPQS
jgi:putative restriction endonuclease